MNAKQKMDAALKAKWVEALRSGEFKQTRFELESVKGGFCCLGVLCAVSSKPTREGSNIDRSYKWVKEIVGEDRFGELVGLNDGGLAPFSEIADYIEENL